MSQLNRISPDFRDGLLEMIRKSPNEKEIAVEGAIKTAHVYVEKVIGPWISKLSSAEVSELERLLNEVIELDEGSLKKALSHPFALPITMVSE